jgi:hypothetical protein
VQKARELAIFVPHLQLDVVRAKGKTQYREAERRSCMQFVQAVLK